MDSKHTYVVVVVVVVAVVGVAVSVHVPESTNGILIMQTLLLLLLASL